MKRASLYRRAALYMLAGLVLGAIMSEASFLFLSNGETRPPETIEIDIPAGTAAEVLQGKTDPALPSSLNFVVGDSLMVKNQDSVVHQLGPLFIPPGTSATVKLDALQDYVVSCSFEPSKYLGLKLQPALTPTTRIVGVLEAGVPMGFLLVLYGLFAMPSEKAKPE